MDREGVKVIRAQILNDGEAEGYTMHQMMIYAALDDGGDGWEAERDFILMQDTGGFDIPLEADAPGWDFEVYCVLEISDELNISLTVDPAGVAKMKDLERVMKNHDEDLTAHPYLAALASSAAAAIIAAVTVNVGDWKEWSGAERETYPLCAEAAIEGASEEMYPVGTLTSESFDAAKKAGVRPVIESVKGGVRLLAKTRPSAALTACVALIGDNLGVTPGRDIKMPLASDSVIGGIKVRADSGLVIDEEGYLSVDPITPEDIEAMMGEE